MILFPQRMTSTAAARVWAVAMLLLAGMVMTGVMQPPTAGAADVPQKTVLLDDLPGDLSSFGVSPDGKKLYFCSRDSVLALDERARLLERFLVGSPRFIVPLKDGRFAISPSGATGGIYVRYFVSTLPKPETTSATTPASATEPPASTGPAAKGQKKVIEDTGALDIVVSGPKPGMSDIRPIAVDEAGARLFVLESPEVKPAMTSPGSSQRVTIYMIGRTDKVLGEFIVPIPPAVPSATSPAPLPVPTSVGDSAIAYDATRKIIYVQLAGTKFLQAFDETGKLLGKVPGHSGVTVLKDGRVATLRLDPKAVPNKPSATEYVPVISVYAPAGTGSGAAAGFALLFNLAVPPRADGRVQLDLAGRMLGADDFGRLYVSNPADPRTTVTLWESDFKTPFSFGPRHVAIEASFPESFVSGKEVVVPVKVAGRPEPDNRDQWKVLWRPSDGSRTDWESVKVTYDAAKATIAFAMPEAAVGACDLRLAFGGLPLSILEEQKAVYLPYTAFVSPANSATRCISTFTTSGRRSFVRGETIALRVVRSRPETAGATAPGAATPGGARPAGSTGSAGSASPSPSRPSSSAPATSRPGSTPGAASAGTGQLCVYSQAGSLVGKQDIALTTVPGSSALNMALELSGDFTRRLAPGTYQVRVETNGSGSEADQPWGMSFTIAQAEPVSLLARILERQRQLDAEQLVGSGASASGATISAADRLIGIRDSLNGLSNLNFSGESGMLWPVGNGSGTGIGTSTGAVLQVPFNAARPAAETLYAGTGAGKGALRDTYLDLLSRNGLTLETGFANPGSTVNGGTATGTSTAPFRDDALPGLIAALHTQAQAVSRFPSLSGIVVGPDFAFPGGMSVLAADDAKWLKEIQVTRFPGRPTNDALLYVLRRMYDALSTTLHSVLPEADMTVATVWPRLSPLDIYAPRKQDGMAGTSGSTRGSASGNTNGKGAGVAIETTLPWAAPAAHDILKRPRLPALSTLEAGEGVLGWQKYVRDAFQVAGRGTQGIGLRTSGALSPVESYTTRAMNQILKMYGPLFAECPSGNFGAILYSSTQQNVESGSGAGAVAASRAHDEAVLGLYGSALMAGLPLRVVSEDELLEGVLVPETIPALFLAGQKERLPLEVRDVITKFVANGGRVYFDAGSSETAFGATGPMVKPLGFAGAPVPPAGFGLTDAGATGDLAFPAAFPGLAANAKKLKEVAGPDLNSTLPLQVDTDDAFTGKNYFDGGAIQYVLLTSDSSPFPWQPGEVWSLGWRYADSFLPRTVLLTMQPKQPASTALYDVFNHKRLEQITGNYAGLDKSSKLWTDLSLMPGRLLAVSPAPLAAPGLSARFEGADIKFEVKIQTVQPEPVAPPAPAPAPAAAPAASATPPAAGADAADKDKDKGDDAAPDASGGLANRPGASVPPPVPPGAAGADATPAPAAHVIPTLAARVPVRIRLISADAKKDENGHIVYEEAGASGPGLGLGSGSGSAGTAGRGTATPFVEMYRLTNADGIFSGTLPAPLATVGRSWSLEVTELIGGNCSVIALDKSATPAPPVLGQIKPTVHMVRPTQFADFMARAHRQGIIRVEVPTLTFLPDDIQQDLKNAFAKHSVLLRSATVSTETAPASPELTLVLGLAPYRMPNGTLSQGYSPLIQNVGSRGILGVYDSPNMPGAGGAILAPVASARAYKDDCIFLLGGDPEGLRTAIRAIQNWTAPTAAGAAPSTTATTATPTTASPSPVPATAATPPSSPASPSPSPTAAGISPTTTATTASAPASATPAPAQPTPPPAPIPVTGSAPDLPLARELFGIPITGLDISSDGRSLVFSADGLHRNLSLIQIDGKNVKFVRSERLGQGPALRYPWVSNDGRYIGGVVRSLHRYGQALCLVDTTTGARTVFPVYGDLAPQLTRFGISGNTKYIIVPGRYGTVGWRRNDSPGSATGTYEQLWTIEGTKTFSTTDWPTGAPASPSQSPAAASSPSFSSNVSLPVRTPLSQASVPAGADYALLLRSESVEPPAGSTPIPMQMTSQGNSSLAAVGLEDGQERWRYDIPAAAPGTRVVPTLYSSPNGSRFLLQTTTTSLQAPGSDPQTGSSVTLALASTITLVEFGQPIAHWSTAQAPSAVGIANGNGTMAFAYPERMLEIRDNLGKLLYTTQWAARPVGLTFSPDGKTLYLSDELRRLTALELSGKQLWQIQTDTPVQLVATFEGVFAAGLNGRLSWIGADGRGLWQMDINPAITVPLPLKELATAHVATPTTGRSAAAAPGSGSAVPAPIIYTPSGGHLQPLDNLSAAPRITGTGATLTIGGGGWSSPEEAAKSIDAALLTDGKRDNVTKPWIPLPHLAAVAFGGHPVWVRIDFPSPTDITALRVSESSGFPDSIPTESLIQVWSEAESAWKTVSYNVALKDLVNTYKLDLKAVRSLRYLPMNGILHNLYTSEIEIFGAPSTPSVPAPAAAP